MTRVELMNQTMGERIRILRNSKGLTQTQLGELVGAAKTTVSSWETEDAIDIKIATFLDLVRVLGTTPEWLAHGDTRVVAPNLPGGRKLRDSK